MPRISTILTGGDNTCQRVRRAARADAKKQNYQTNPFGLLASSNNKCLAVSKRTHLGAVGRSSLVLPCVLLHSLNITRGRAAASIEAPRVGATGVKARLTAGTAQAGVG